MAVINPISATRSIYLGSRYWPGRYIITSGYWYWTGRLQAQGDPQVTLDLERALVFVSARHAYERARKVRALQSWRVRRLQSRSDGARMAAPAA